jgi:hypothetical protein
LQVLEITSDACLLEPEIGIGGSICRLKTLNSSQNNQNMSQILRGCWIFPASQSFEAELLTGVHSIVECLKRINPTSTDPNLKLKIRWYCDLPYLNDLFLNKDAGSNSKLRDLIEQIIILTQGHSFEVVYPTQASELKYHNYCHRICSEIRSGLKENNHTSENPQIIGKQILSKHKKWTLISFNL